MNNIEFPSLVDNMNEHIENKLIKIGNDGLKMYNFFKRASKWEELYTILETELGEYWIQELKGIKFKKYKEARMYCFLDYCEKSYKG